MTSEMKVAPPDVIILYLIPHLLQEHCWSGANKISGTQSPISRRILQQLFFFSRPPIFLSSVA